MVAWGGGCDEKGDWVWERQMKEGLKHMNRMEEIRMQKNRMQEIRMQENRMQENRMEEIRMQEIQEKTVGPAVLGTPKPNRTY